MISRKYRTLFATALAERFAYRTDFLIGTLMRFLPIVTTLFLWTAIFAGSDQSQIAGLDRDGMVAYYLLVMISRAFSSMPGLTNTIALDIREGSLKKFLIQPVSYLGYLLVTRTAHKVAYYSLAFVPFFLVYYWCSGFFDGWPSAPVLTAFICSLVLAYFMGFLLETLIGLLAFWMLEVSSFAWIVMTLAYVLSGHMFPLDLLPEPWFTLLQWLPFQYLAYFPAKIFLHGDTWGAELTWSQVGGQAVYTLVMFLLVQLTFRAGLQRYSAFGG